VGYNRVPGPVKEGDSHRCELADLYAIVTLVNCLCHHHRITQGSILVACDNTGALKPGAVDFLPKCSQKNLDLLQAIWKTIQESPIEWTTQHVYGHQDRKAKDSHRCLATLNCAMDALAKQHWAHIYAKVHLTPAPHILIHNEGWTIWSGTDKVVAPSCNALHSLLADQPTQMWWVRHNHISETAKYLVDWETCSTGMKALKPGRRRWITKHASANCGVSTTLLTWKYQDDDQCPCCGRSESTTHVLTCTAMGANEVWNENLDKVAQCLTDSDTLLALQEAILTNLACWRQSQLPRVSFDDSSVTAAAQSQSSIGWKNMIEGLLSSEWRQLQQRHYNSRRSRKSSKRWAWGLFLKLHHLAWNQWKHRNDIKHRHVRPRHHTANLALNSNICLFYRNGGQDLPPSL